MGIKPELIISRTETRRSYLDNGKNDFFPMKVAYIQLWLKLVKP